MSTNAEQFSSSASHRTPRPSLPTPLSRSETVEAILDSLDEGVVTISDEGTILAINAAACGILEVQRNDTLHQGCPCIFGDEFCADASRIRQSIAERKPIHGIEVQLETRSGRRKVLNVRTGVLRDRDGASLGGLVVFRDITELVRLQEDLHGRSRLHNIIGKSKAIRDVFTLIEQVADSSASVLIEGETGTGKELVARAIHALSPRRGGPFVAVNCSALPETLLESELFGHVRGAFTGAVRDKPGRFEAASGGTIFLDEIGEVSPLIQVKLLRVLQEHVLERVGGERSINIDIRVLSASNRPLDELVRQGAFRQDLLYRLRVVPIRLPALRERRDDIPLLAQHFIDRFRQETGRPIEGLDAEAAAALLDSHWPGNVRELENAIEYAFVKTRAGRIGRSHLPGEVLTLSERAPSGDGLGGSDAFGGSRALPPDVVAQALTRAGGNVSKAARALNVSRTTLYKRMHEYGLHAD